MATRKQITESWIHNYSSLLLDKDKKIEQLEAKLKIAVEALEFYGDYNYKCEVVPFYDRFNFCDEENDYEKKGSTHMMVAGKRARQALKSLRTTDTGGEVKNES